MFRVSLILEALRARPTLMFWVAALAQGALWTLVPSLFYAAPPGEVPLVLAVGREWLLGSPYGPPLAYWLADFAYRLAGGSIVGVTCCRSSAWSSRSGRYSCSAVASWALRTPPWRSCDGRHQRVHGADEFGPAVLAMPLTALSLLFGYDALADNKRLDWPRLAQCSACSCSPPMPGLILLALFVMFVVATGRGRSRLRSIGPIAALLVVVVVNSGHLLWLRRTGFDPLPALKALPA